MVVAVRSGDEGAGGSPPAVEGPSRLSASCAGLRRGRSERTVQVSHATHGWPQGPCRIACGTCGDERAPPPRRWPCEILVSSLRLRVSFSVWRAWRPGLLSSTLSHPHLARVCQRACGSQLSAPRTRAGVGEAAQETAGSSPVCRQRVCYMSDTFPGTGDFGEEQNTAPPLRGRTK